MRTYPVTGPELAGPADLRVGDPVVHIAQVVRFSLEDSIFPACHWGAHATSSAGTSSERSFDTYTKPQSRQSYPTCVCGAGPVGSTGIVPGPIPDNLGHSSLQSTVEMFRLQARWR